MKKQGIGRWSLRAKIVGPIVGGLLVVGLAGSFYLYQKRIGEIEGSARERLGWRAEAVQRVIAAKGDEAVAMSAFLAGMPQVQKALAEGDRKTISDLTLAAYQASKDKLGMAQLQFHLPPARSFFRAHLPQKFGDDLSSFRFTVLAVNKDHKDIKGLEVGVGGAGLRGVTPVSYQGRHVGSVEFGGDLTDAFAKEIKDAQGFDISIVAPDGKGGFKFWAKTEGMSIPESSHPALKQVLESGKVLVRRMQKGGQDILVHYEPLRDFSNKPVSILAIPQDISQLVAGAKREMWLTLAGVAAVMILLGLVSALTATGVARQLGRLSARLVGSAEDVAQAAGDVEQTSQRLAQGASQQAAALEETSSSLEEMSSMTKTNADNAQQANQLMGEIVKVVERTKGSMLSLTGAMGEIQAASEQTSKIVRTIDEISFQTNLLALNAAVEAARAGEAGAGFAVVAEEVRSLAMRAAEAAKNTAALIEGTVAKVKSGADLVNRTNQDFEAVAGSSAKAAELVGEIAAASAEQAQGIEQVNRASGELDQVTQQNAANAEESSAASEQLSSQSQAMRELALELVAIVGGSTRGRI